MDVLECDCDELEEIAIEYLTDLRNFIRQVRNFLFLRF